MEKMYKYGDTQQSIDITLEYTTVDVKDGSKTDVHVSKTAYLNCNSYEQGGLTIQGILDFQKQANRLLKLTKELLRKGIFVQFTLTKSAYEHVDEHPVPDGIGTTTLNTLDFNYWEFTGNALDGDPDNEEGGLYLRPDTRYTPEHWDIFIPWNQDILEALAAAHL